MPVTRNEKIFDADCQLKDAGLIAADAAAEVASVAKYYDCGDAEIEGYLIIEVTACEVASGNENYKIKLQGDSSSAFATALVDLAVFDAGDATTLVGSSDVGIGRYVIPFSNVFGGTQKRYLRLYTDVTGTIATGINYEAFLTV